MQTLVEDLMKPVKDDDVAAYQKLVEMEYEKYEKLKNIGYDFDKPMTFLTAEDIRRVGIDDNTLNDMLSRGLIIQFGRDLYRTTHFDLIYRLTRIRYFESQPPLTLEFNITMKKELVPDFGAYKVDDIFETIKSPYKDLILKLLSTSLHKKGYEGLSSYQYQIIKELLSGSHKNVAIVAPTASGKTLAFLIPVLVRSIERAIQNRGGVTGLLIYPRRALERDQLQSLLQLVDVINEELQANGKSIITVGIDDGDTPREGQVNDGDSFRKLKCVRCGGELIIKRQGALVVCQKCQKEYQYIMSTKDRIWREKPTILVTNIWTVYRRLLSRRGISMFYNMDFVVVDEAHVYSHFLGGHVNHILRMLRFVSGLHGSVPTFVFSSATIPNPREFISNLSGVSEDELFYIDFQETLERARGKKLNRILLYLYLLPHPNWNVETLTEALILAITLWCHRNKMKGITFIDSVSEINTMMDYIHTTILGTRKGREVTDHIFRTRSFPDNDYCWITLAPRNYSSSSESESEFEDFILNDYKQSIGMHYGGLSLEKRARIESEFSKGSKRMLLSTSTLELGIDLSDVAVILQYKLPLTPEGVVQRIGRAGRDPECYRIALGVIVLPALPLSTLYMFNDKLRETLENVGSLPPLRVGKASDNIKLQHVLSLLLLKRALEGKQTYIDMDEAIRTDLDVINCLEEIKEEIKDLLDFNKNVDLIEEEILRDSAGKLEKKLTDLLEGLNKMRVGRYQTKMYNNIVNNIRNDIESGLEHINNIRKIGYELNNIIPLTNMSLPEVEKWLSSRVIKPSELISSIMRDLQSLVRRTIENKEPYLVDKWLQENRGTFMNAMAQLPDSNEPIEIFLKYLAQASVKIVYDIMLKISKLGKMISDVKDTLNKTLSDLDLFKSADLKAMHAELALKRVKGKMGITGSKLDLFQLLNLLFEGEIHLSLLLEPPSPDLELTGVDEV